MAALTARSAAALLRCSRAAIRKRGSAPTELQRKAAALLCSWPQRFVLALLRGAAGRPGAVRAAARARRAQEQGAAAVTSDLTSLPLDLRLLLLPGPLRSVNRTST